MVPHGRIFHYPTADAVEILANAISLLEERDPGVDGGERDALAALRWKAERWDAVTDIQGDAHFPPAAVLHEE